MVDAVSVVWCWDWLSQITAWHGVSGSGVTPLLPRVTLDCHVWQSQHTCLCHTMLWSVNRLVKLAAWPLGDDAIAREWKLLSETYSSNCMCPRLHSIVRINSWPMTGSRQMWHQPDTCCNQSETQEWSCFPCLVLVSYLHSESQDF